MMEFSDFKLPMLAFAIAVLWLAESLAPHFAAYLRNVRARRVHAVRNAVLAVINGLLGVLALGALIAGSVLLVASHGFGLVRMLDMPPWVAFLLAFVLFDLWMYWWHRINHEIPFLWRFHRVHHSDPRMDVTTALRFHPGEIILSTMARLLVVNLIGMELWHLALYELVALPIVAFHHSNIAMPRRWDDAMRWLIVTPWMHWVHHSRLREETNSNYSSVLSVWDRLFGSYRFRYDPNAIEFGLNEFPDDDDNQGVRGLLITPVRAERPESAKGKPAQETVPPDG